MIYDILDLFYDLFYKLRHLKKQTYTKLICVITAVLICIIINLTIFFTDCKIRPYKEEIDNPVVYSEIFKNRKMYIENYNILFKSVYKSNKGIHKTYIIGWKYKLNFGEDVYYILITPNKKNIYFFPERQLVYIENIEILSKVKKDLKEKGLIFFNEIYLINNERDFRIKKMLDFLKNVN